MSQALLLFAAVVAVGVLHTMVPDHWVPIALIARQRGWTKVQTARAAAGAGIGHTLSTLAIGVLVWIAGAAFAARFGHAVSIASSFALIGFGGWIAISSWREMQPGHDHPHDAPPVNQERTALLLILGSSPMVEGIPAFFAASKLGAGVLAVMALLFAASTILTYAVLCVYSSEALSRLSFGKLERYGEVLSGALIAVVGIVFLVWPIE